MKDQYLILVAIIEHAHIARIAADAGADDRYHEAMHTIRELAWDGKQIIHERSLARYVRPVAPKRVKRLSSANLDDILELL